MRVLSYIHATKWLMLEEDYELMYQVAARNSEAIDRLVNFAEKNGGESLKPESLMKKSGDQMQGTRYVEQREGGVAVIDVNGVIAKRMNLMADLCDGGTSTELLAKDFQSAIDNPTVKSIVLNIDSPGGEAFGVNELAQQIYQARGKKPVKAYVSGYGASAAYYIAAACDEVICAADAVLGSVGVVSESQDATEFYKKLGIDRKVITSSNAPNKRPDLNTDEGMSQFRATLDGIEKPFIQSIAKFRSMTSADVIERFNHGGVFVGRDAVKAGMADRTGSLEQVISELKRSTKPQQQQPLNNKNKAVSALSTLQPKANIKENDMSLAEKIKAFFASDEIATLLETDANNTGDPSAETITAAIVAQSNVETEKLRAQLAEATAERNRLAQEKLDAAHASFSARAAEFVASERKSGRLTPAESDDFQAAYTQALMDDHAAPLAEGKPSRAATLEAAQSKRKAHAFTEETVPANLKVVAAESDDEEISNGGSDADNSNGGTISAARQKELLEKTHLGKAAIALVK